MVPTCPDISLACSPSAETFASFFSIILSIIFSKRSSREFIISRTVIMSAECFFTEASTTPWIWYRLASEISLLAAAPFALAIGAGAATVADASGAVCCGTC